MGNKKGEWMWVGGLRTSGERRDGQLKQIQASPPLPLPLRGASWGCSLVPCLLPLPHLFCWLSTCFFSPSSSPACRDHVASRQEFWPPACAEQVTALVTGLVRRCGWVAGADNRRAFMQVGAARVWRATYSAAMAAAPLLLPHV